LSQSTKPRVCAVSFSNTTPLVWGMMHGRQRGMFELEFRLPSECADALKTGEADIGIVPSFELTRQRLDILPGAGIACHGAVRSILLIAKKPLGEVRTLAADSSSRTSVELARVVLDRKYGARPRVLAHAPKLDAMLGAADAALIIGDPALRLDLAHLPYEICDLGAEWVEMTGFPMVFAVWAARKGVAEESVAQAFRDSRRFGLEHMDEIVAAEAARLGFAPELVRDYLTRHIVHELGPRDYQGMRLFLEWAGGEAAGVQAALASIG
jgi:predicted solute-binding protein